MSKPTKDSLDTLKQDYTNHLREYRAIERQDGPKHAFNVKGGILRRLFSLISNYPQPKQ